MDQVCHSQGKIKGKQYQTIWKNNNFLRSGNIFDNVKVSEKSGNSIFIAPKSAERCKGFKNGDKFGDLQKEISKCKKGLIQGL